jgi:antitoxin HicB
MKTSKKRLHVGSSFDDFLKEEGIFEEVEAGALKKIAAYELELELKRRKRKLRKSSKASAKELVKP